MVDVMVGRTAELDALDALLADRLPEPRALLIDGEPGIGKTTLLQALRTLARDRGYLVLTCRPTRSEMDLSYVGLLELLDGVDDDVVAALPAPQARVLRMVLRRQEPEGTFDRLSLGVALVAVVRAVARIRPVLVAVDDAQWLDHSTARTLSFAVRRLAGTPTRVAVVRSEGAPGSSRLVDWPTELERAMPGRVDRLRLGPTGPGDLSRILRRVLGWVPAWPRVVRIAELSGGNPLYALELTRAYGGVRSAEELDGVLPDGALELARSRIAKLPDRVRAALELACVPRAPRLELLRRLDPTALDVREALSAAARAGIVTVTGEDGIRFTHPILAAAVYGAMPLPRRRDLHRAVAVLTDDLEERARHLARAADGPDPQVALAVEAAAERAWRRGAPDAAADLLRLACQLTPVGHAEALALRRIAYGRLLHSAGDAPAAAAELEALVAELPAGPLRARALYHLMYVTRLSGWLARALEYGERAAVEAAGDASLQAEVYELLSRLSDNDIARKLDTARRGLRALERVPVPDPDVAFYVQAALVEAEFYAGLGIHLDRLDGLDPGDRPRFPPVRTASRGDDLIGRLLTYDGRIDEGQAVLRGMYERAAVESRSIMPAVLGWMAEGHIIAGRFTTAAELTREAIDRAEETGQAGGNPYEIGYHAVALAMLGELERAETVATPVVEAAAADPEPVVDALPARIALGTVALARSRYPEAADHFRQVGEAKRRAGVADPRLWPHHGDLVEALVAAGALAEAGEVLTGFVAAAAACAGQWPLGVAARGEALLFAAGGDLDGALAAALRSRELLASLPMPFERARTELALGQIHRRRREKRLARTALDAALAAFGELGTHGWAERTRAELERVPGQRATDGLTPTEQRIARLVVDGLTNREIADRTFLSPKTVEVNLTRIYRKLGVRSRAVLATRLATDPAAPRREVPQPKVPQPKVPQPEVPQAEVLQPEVLQTEAPQAEV